ncbi:glycosyltransferase family 2 protein [Nitrosococcus watsonii]|uniref:Glycosyl transferase family 2 n=1 Tax=Nitrosococcus watsoni (strain C-113) TaxID=105559 RepID=D8K578_NITWC|nr:glycosyltransferase family 2 protein [Nitrosococcus watsonii]ADJ28055.1 glycosyl transferase family 2 [Nitrosococcus watsonii C-113]
MANLKLPTISIVTPSFNQGEYVEWTVQSVLGQRYPNLEYIFMDGGSTDQTLDRIAPYRNRFFHFESGPDGGQSAAIAKGFSMATGEIMAYLNSDDVLLPGTLNFVVDYFHRHPEVDFIYGHRCIVNEINQVIGHWILPRHSSFLMRRWDLIPQESCFWRRRLFKQKGNIDASFQFAMDYDLFVRYMSAGNFKRVNRFLAAFRVHKDAKTTTQLTTTGWAEIERVQRCNQMQFPPLLGKLFPLWVQLRSLLFVRRRESFPGLPPGLNFNLNTLWGD